MRSKTSDPSASSHPVLTRRRLLGGTAVAGGAAVIGACTPDPSDSVAPKTVPVARVDKVPVDDPEAEAWEYGSEVEVVMDAQKIALPHRQAPYRESIKVRAIHDGTMIGFKLSWEDGEPDADTVTVDGFRDACAVLFAPGEGDDGLRVMGSADKPAILVHWKADWQHDMDEGIRTIRDMFPNATVDTYPPLGGTTMSTEVTPATYVEAGATQWLPGMHVGNALGLPGAHPACREAGRPQLRQRDAHRHPGCGGARSAGRGWLACRHRQAAGGQRSRRGRAGCRPDLHGGLCHLVGWRRRLGRAQDTQP